VEHTVSSQKVTAQYHKLISGDIYFNNIKETQKNFKFTLILYIIKADFIFAGPL
jgi:hypothetical protein